MSFENKNTWHALGHLQMQASRRDMFGISARTYLKTKIEIYKLDFICRFELMRNLSTLEEDHRVNKFMNIWT
jgi:hypothetical protein